MVFTLLSSCEFNNDQELPNVPNYEDNSLNLLKTRVKDDVTKTTKDDISTHSLNEGCDCEIIVNSVTGTFSEWSISQSMTCGGFYPLFTMSQPECCNPCNPTELEVWEPFNCNHPIGETNVINFSSLFHNGDDCDVVIPNVAFGEDPCEFSEYFAPATAVITIRCKNPKTGEVGAYNSRTFVLNSNVGDPEEICETFGNLGSASFTLNSNCQFRAQ